MHSSINRILKSSKNLFVLLGAFALIVFFQNCEKSSFHTQLPGNLEITAENTNNSSELANDDLPEADGINDVAAISSGSASENDPAISVDNAMNSILATRSTGKVYYVSTSGSNSNAGTSSRPFRTIAYAVSKMVAGDTTYVRGGVYNEILISFGRSGTQAAPIKLLNYPGESPIIDFGLVKYDTSKIRRVQFSNSAGTNKGIGWITLEGFEIRHGHDGIKFYNLHNSVIRRNWVHHNFSQGILGQGGHHNIFDRNRISHNGNFSGCAAGHLTASGTTVCNQTHGMYMYGNYYTLTNNLIYDNLAFGIQVNASASSVYKSTAHPSTEFAGTKNWTIANNTLAYNNYRGAITLWGNALNMRIENNIFHENCSKENSKCAYVQGINISSSVRGAVLRNNIFYASGAGASRPYSSTAVVGVHYTASNNIINTLSPKFVNAGAIIPSSPNFMLTSSSPAINRGLTTSATKVDFRGVARPRGSAYDIGAYEY